MNRTPTKNWPFFLLATFPMLAAAAGVVMNNADVDRKVAAMNAMIQQVQVAAKQ